MERTLAVTVALLLIVFTVVSGAFALSGGFNRQEAVALESELPVKEAPVSMTLGTYQGHLALFLGDGRYPNEIYDVLLRSLPPEDQKRLSDGLSVSSEAELRRLLEDFTS